MNGDSRSWYQPPEVMTDGHHKSGIILVVAGLMIRDGLVDVQTYINYIGDAPIQMWNKYKEIIVEFRICARRRGSSNLRTINTIIYKRCNPFTWFHSH